MDVPGCISLVMRRNFRTRNIVAIYANNHLRVGSGNSGGQSIRIQEEIVSISINRHLVGVGRCGMSEFGGINGFLGGPFHFTRCIPIITGGKLSSPCGEQIVGIGQLLNEDGCFFISRNR